MRRSLKKLTRNREKCREWALKECIRDIDEFRLRYELPAPFVAKGMFSVMQMPYHKYKMLGLVVPGDTVFVLDIVPRVNENGYTKFTSSFVFVLFTAKGFGHMTFDKHLGDGGMFPRIARMLEAL